MGLAIEVGAFPGADDPEGQHYMRAQLEAVNRHLKAAGVSPHHEPEGIEPSQVLSLEMFGYSGLHYFRRMAVYLDAGRDLPAPGDDTAPDDQLMKAFYSQADGDVPDLMDRILRRRPSFGRAFDHLLLHGDAEGYYIPTDFKEVIFAPDTEVAGGMIGSSQSLERECRRLLEVMRVPASMDPESEELWNAADAQGDVTEGWQRYGIEAFTGVRLLRAAERSIASGAAIVFC